MSDHEFEWQAVAEELDALMGSDVSAVVRFEADGTVAVLDSEDPNPAGMPEMVRAPGIRSRLASRIVVDGELWGAITVASLDRPLSDGAERHLADFTELAAGAIANAASRERLAALRARLVTEADAARRQLVRDLHDGAQQQLVTVIMSLRSALRALRADDADADALVGDALVDAERAHEELRELAHGILPAALTHGGLRAGVGAVVERLDLPVQVHLPPERFAAELEASAYFIVAEALTNVVKHAHATRAEVTASVENGTLRVEIRDDGMGGADSTGHGLVGIGDRATALGGRLDVASPAGGGTLVTATLPLPSR